MNNKIKFYSFAILGLLSLNDNRFREKMEDKQFRIQEKIEQKVEQKVENRIGNIKNKFVKLENVKITALDATSLTIDNNGTLVKVNIASNTQLRRKFWGKSEISEFSAGNYINVIGKWGDDTKVAIEARLIRNLSIQKRHGVFFGEVKSIDGEKIVITTIRRDEQTVTIGSAKLVNRKEGVINKSDILVGHKIRVKGLWDSTNNTITEVKEIKDFSLPIKPSPTPKAS